MPEKTHNSSSKSSVTVQQENQTSEGYRVVSDQHSSRTTNRSDYTSNKHTGQSYTNKSIKHNQNFLNDKSTLSKIDLYNKSETLTLEAKAKFEQEVSNMQFEEAFEQLKEISNHLDSGGVSLSQTMRYLELAVILKAHCKKILESFKFKVEEILAPENDKQ